MIASSYSERDSKGAEGLALSSFSRHIPEYSSIVNRDLNQSREHDLDAFDDYTPPPTCTSRLKIVKKLIIDYWILYVQPYELYLAVLILILCTSAERVTFKIMIDRMIPYKFILLEIIFIASWSVFGMVTMGLELTTHEITAQMKTFPQEKVFLMAVLDTLQFFGVVYSGIGVSPTMTIILLHASTLFILVGSKAVFPGRRYGWFHQVGITLISIAILLGFVKIVFYDYLYNNTGENDFLATKAAVAYILSSCLQGLSTLYKEKALADWAQPVNIYFISSRLFLYQFFVTLLFSFIYYVYEAFLGNADRIPSGLYYGWRCFLGSTPTDMNRDDDMTAYYVSCSHSLWLISGYVLSTVGVMMSINVVLRLNSQLVSKAICAAILMAFVVLWLYDVSTTPLQANPFVFGGSVGAADLVAIGVLLVGMDIYGRDPEPDVELITNYTHSPVSTASACESGPDDPWASDPMIQKFEQLRRK